MNGKTIPDSARLSCAACEVYYDYRDTPDRSCPDCGCPPATVVELRGATADFNGSRHFVANPVLPAWLSKHAEHVKSVRQRRYSRDSMRKRRSEQTESADTDSGQAE